MTVPSSGLRGLLQTLPVRLLVLIRSVDSGLAALIVATVPVWTVLINAAVTRSRYGTGTATR
jgi:hypothetical protein